MHAQPEKDTRRAELKFQNLAGELRRDILAGTWSVGAKLPTEQQLMTETGLSLTTVRRAFDELVRQQLVTRRRGSGSFVAERRPGARIRNRVRIGVLIPDTQLYYGRVLQGIEDYLSSVGADLQLSTYQYDAAREDAAITRLLEADVDGLILVPTLTGGAEAVQRVETLLSLQVPVVLMERRLHQLGPADRTEHVISDHAGGSYDAVSHLWRLGHRRIAVLYRAQTPTAIGVIDGYRAAAQDRGFEPNEAGVTKADWNPERADDFVLALREQEITAALVFGDREATLIQSAARRAGFSVPYDLALVSYDDEMADLAEVPLTAVAPAKHRVGRLAAEVMVRRIAEGDSGPLHQVRLRPRLVIRESCGHTKINNPTTSREEI